MSSATNTLQARAGWPVTIGAWVLALAWITPFLYALWAAVHPSEFATRLGIQLVLCTLAAYAFARYTFAGKNVLFALVLVQLMVMPEILIVRNYQTLTTLGFVDTLFGIGLPYFASAFAIFLLRQTFMTIPKELVEAAVMEGASPLQV